MANEFAEFKLRYSDLGRLVTEHKLGFVRYLQNSLLILCLCLKGAFSVGFDWITVHTAVRSVHIYSQKETSTSC